MQRVKMASSLDDDLVSVAVRLNRIRHFLRDISLAIKTHYPESSLSRSLQAKATRSLVELDLSTGLLSSIRNHRTLPPTFDVLPGESHNGQPPKSCVWKQRSSARPLVPEHAANDVPIVDDEHGNRSARQILDDYMECPCSLRNCGVSLSLSPAASGYSL